MWIPSDVLFEALFAPIPLSVAQLSAAGVYDDPDADRLACALRLRVAGGVTFVALVYSAPSGATCEAKARFACEDVEACVDGVRRAIVGSYVNARESIAPLPTME